MSVPATRVGGGCRRRLCPSGPAARRAGGVRLRRRRGSRSRGSGRRGCGPSRRAWATSGTPSAIIQVLWPWRSPWKVRPGLTARQPQARVAAVEGAVDGRAQGAAAEVAAPVQLPVGADEHEPMIVGGQVGAQQLDQERRQGDGAGGLGGLGRSELEAAAGLDAGRPRCGVDHDDRARRYRRRCRGGCGCVAARPARPSGPRSRRR